MTLNNHPWSPIDIQPHEFLIIRSILTRSLPKNSKVYVFGSRAELNKAKPYSDLDLAIDVGSRLSLALLADLREEFINSDLTYTVDLVDLNATETEFKEAIIPKCVVFPI